MGLVFFFFLDEFILYLRRVVFVSFFFADDGCHTRFYCIFFGEQVWWSG